MKYHFSCQTECSRLLGLNPEQKMPVTFRFSGFHLNYLASLAREQPTLSGELYIKDTEHSTPKWQKRWSVLYQNFLFYFENSSCPKPIGMIFLEHSTIDVVSLTKLRDLSNQVNKAYMTSVHKGVDHV